MLGKPPSDERGPNGAEADQEPRPADPEPSNTQAAAFDVPTAVPAVPVPTCPGCGVLNPDSTRVTEIVRDALSALAHKPERDPVTQRFVTGSLAAGKTLARSEQFWSAVEPAKRELVERVRTDLAVDGSSVETLLGLIDGYAEARLFRASMFLRLVDQGGPITTKGKARALYRAYLDALDRETKLAQVLGLERRAKRVDSFAAAVAQEPRA